MATASPVGPLRQFQREATHGDQYYKVSDGKVAYSVELSDVVTADYDAAGEVRSIEFIGKRTAPLDSYLETARKASRGPARKRPKIPG
jgi:hypothetical protein